MSENKLSYRIEYAAFRGLGRLVRVLPYRAALACGWLLALISFHLMRARIQTARERIRKVMGAALSTRQVNRIAWLSWRNICFSAVEMLRLPAIDSAFIEKHVEGKQILQILHQLKKEGHGGIIAVPHCGSWELGGHLGHFEGIPVFSIAAVQRNQLINAEMNRLRQYHGIITLARGSGTMRRVLRMLKDGNFLLILPDTRQRTPGISVNFLGAPANLATGMAQFARQADVPIIPGIVIRNDWTKHCVHCANPVWPDKTLDKQQDIARMTRIVLQYIEKEIRKQPEQWFWFNKRWIHDPLTDNQTKEQLSNDSTE